MWVRIGTLAILAMLAFMILVVLIMTMWALVRVVSMPNRCRLLTPGQCWRRHSAPIVRIANLHDITSYNMMLGVQLGTKI